MCRERSLTCKNEERGDGEEGKLFLFSLPPPPSIFHFFYSPSNVPAITRLKTERFLRWLVPCTWLEVCLCGCFQGEETEVWARPLYDGSVAIALFSRAQYRGTMFASFEMVSTFFHTIGWKNRLGPSNFGIRGKRDLGRGQNYSGHRGRGWKITMVGMGRLPPPTLNGKIILVISLVNFRLDCLRQWLWPVISLNTKILENTKTCLRQK